MGSWFLAWGLSSSISLSSCCNFTLFQVSFPCQLYCKIYEMNVSCSEILQWSLFSTCSMFPYSSTHAQLKVKTCVLQRTSYNRLMQKKYRFTFYISHRGKKKKSLYSNLRLVLWIWNWGKYCIYLFIHQIYSYVYMYAWV